MVLIREDFRKKTRPTAGRNPVKTKGIRSNAVMNGKKMDFRKDVLIMVQGRTRDNQESCLIEGLRGTLADGFTQVSGPRKEDSSK